MGIRKQVREVQQIAAQGIPVPFARAAFRDADFCCWRNEDGISVITPCHSLRSNIADSLEWVGRLRSVDRKSARDLLKHARRDIALMALRGVRLP